jgi:hypothetical protein
MTTVITRLYDSEDTASATARRLNREGVPKHALQVITAKGLAREAIAERMRRADVHDSAVPVYADHVAQGDALLVVRATYKPLGAARLTREITAKTKTKSVGDVVDDHYFADGPDHAPSVLKDHPHMLSLDLDFGEYKGGPVSAEFGIPLLTRGHRNRPLRVSRGGGHMSKWFWPMPLVTRKRTANSAISGGRFMSRLFWPMPLLSRKERTRSVIRDGALPFSRALGLPTIIRRPSDG